MGRIAVMGAGSWGGAFALLCERSGQDVTLWARDATLAGRLAGVGDLVATCTSSASRNRTVGVRLGRGEAIDDIVASMEMVAEGVRTAPLLAALAERHGVDMPMVRAVVAVTRDGADVASVGEALLTRPPRSER